MKCLECKVEMRVVDNTPMGEIRMGGPITFKILYQCPKCQRIEMVEKASRGCCLPRLHLAKEDRKYAKDLLGKLEKRKKDRG